MTFFAFCNALFTVSSAVSIYAIMSLALFIYRRSQDVIGFVRSASKDIRGWKPLLKKKGVICVTEDLALLSINSAIDN
jgi:hypothetical protein